MGDLNGKITDRFKLQSVARSYLLDVNTPKGSKFRLLDCYRSRISSDVVVMNAPDSNSFFGNLATCGSVWTCPVCAAKITERRRNELNLLLNYHSEAEGTLVMATLTFSHKRNERLRDLLGGSNRKFGFRGALQKFRNSRVYKRVMKKIGYVGLVRALEVTYGSNGWHPHSHEVLLLDSTVPLERVLKILRGRDMFEAWKRACVASGLNAPSFKHGLDFQLALSPADYLAKFGYSQKWGVGAELTKQHIKQGKGSLTPFDFLRSVGTDDELYFRNLWREYSQAFFGCAQLYYSRGLKNLFNIDDLTDEELANQIEKDSIILFRISKVDWSAILKLPFDIRGDILRYADVGDFEFYKQFL